MRLVDYLVGSEIRPGLALGSPEHTNVVDLRKISARLGRSLDTSSVVDVLKLPDDGYAELAALASSLAEHGSFDGDATPIEQLRVAAPTRRAPLIVCCGMNYLDHRAEMNEAAQRRKPSWFIKNHNAMIAAGEDIELPPDHSDMVDFEGEIAVVFRRDCYKVSAANAMSYVGGYTIVNDVTARNWATGAPLALSDAVESVHAQQLGKQYPTFCAMGPVLLTADEVTDPKDLTFTTRLNEVEMQRGVLTDLVLDVPKLIAAVSSTYLFTAGDVLSTGSPAGTGFGRSPQRFLQPGDVVTIESPRIGLLRNGVRASALADDDTAARNGRLAQRAHIA